MEEKLIYQKIADIMKEIGAIGKTQKNKTQGFMYRGIDDVYGALQPLLAKHEVFTIPQVLEEHSEERQTKAGGTLIYRILRIQYTFFTVDGSSISCIVIGEGMDSGDKAANKAMAIGHKYALLQTFCIPTEDVKDPDAESHEVKPKVTELTVEQWNLIKKLGAEKELTENETKAIVQFCAGQNKISPRSAKIAELMLPVAKFQLILDEYLDSLNDKKIGA